MNIVDLSLKMKRLTQWLDGQRPPDRFIRKRFDGPRLEAATLPSILTGRHASRPAT
jgi:hypothetical protein